VFDSRQEQENFPLVLSVQRDPAVYPTSYSVGKGAFSWGVKRASIKADHLSLSSDGVKNVWSCKITPAYADMVSTVETLGLFTFKPFENFFVARTVVLSLFAGKCVSVLKLILIFVINVQILWYPSSRVQTRPKPSDFSGEKILSTPSFGREVKPSVPCRALRHVKEPESDVEVATFGKISRQVLAHRSTFRC
jgi:hypothetical protein